MTNSATESENETHGAGEHAFASTEEWIEDNISWKFEDFTGASGITSESNRLQSVSEITMNFGWPKEESPATDGQ